MSAPGGLRAAHVAGPMWSVDDRPLVVPPGADAPTVVLSQLAAAVDGPGPWPVEVRQAGVTLDLVLDADGSVTLPPTAARTPLVRPWLREPGSPLVSLMPAPADAAGEGAASTSLPENVSPWLAASAEVRAELQGQAAARDVLQLLSAHPGSGSSTWAQLLGGREVTTETRSAGTVLVVARSTLAGVDAAKPYTSDAAAVLLVADAAGKVPVQVARSIRVLEGAAPVVRVPWVPALRGMVTVPDSPVVKKAAAKVAAAVEKHRRTQ